MFTNTFKKAALGLVATSLIGAAFFGITSVSAETDPAVDPNNANTLSPVFSDVDVLDILNVGGNFEVDSFGSVYDPQGDYVLIKDGLEIRGEGGITNDGNENDGRLRILDPEGIYVDGPIKNPDEGSFTCLATALSQYYTCIQSCITPVSMNADMTDFTMSSSSCSTNCQATYDKWAGTCDANGTLLGAVNIDDPLIVHEGINSLYYTNTFGFNNVFGYNNIWGAMNMISEGNTNDLQPAIKLASGFDLSDYMAFDFHSIETYGDQPVGPKWPLSFNTYSKADVEIGGDLVVTGNIKSTKLSNLYGDPYTAKPVTIADDLMVISSTDAKPTGTGAIKIGSSATDATTLVIDQNEIMTVGNNNPLYINSDSGNDVKIGFRSNTSNLIVNGSVKANSIGRFYTNDYPSKALSSKSYFHTFMSCGEDVVVGGGQKGSAYVTATSSNMYSDTAIVLYVYNLASTSKNYTPYITCFSSNG